MNYTAICSILVAGNSCSNTWYARDFRRAALHALHTTVQASMGTVIYSTTKYSTVSTVSTCI